MAIRSDSPGGSMTSPPGSSRRAGDGRPAARGSRARRRPHRCCPDSPRRCRARPASSASWPADRARPRWNSTGGSARSAHVPSRPSAMGRSAAQVEWPFDRCRIAFRGQVVGEVPVRMDGHPHRLQEPGMDAHPGRHRIGRGVRQAPGRSAASPRGSRRPSGCRTSTASRRRRRRSGTRHRRPASRVGRRPGRGWPCRRGSSRRGRPRARRSGSGAPRSGCTTAP